jgi:hypothetical protein
MCVKEGWRKNGSVWKVIALVWRKAYFAIRVYDI